MVLIKALILFLMQMLKGFHILKVQPRTILENWYLRMCLSLGVESANMNILVHSAADWKYAAEQFVKKLPDKVIVHRECFLLHLIPLLCFALYIRRLLIIYSVLIKYLILHFLDNLRGLMSCNWVSPLVNDLYSTDQMLKEEPFHFEFVQWGEYYTMYILIDVLILFEIGKSCC